MSGYCEKLKESLSYETFSFDNARCKTQWYDHWTQSRRLSPGWYSAFRVFFAVFGVAAIITELCVYAFYGRAQYLYIYLTHWTFTFEIVYACLYVYILNFVPATKEIPTVVKVAWTMRNVLVVLPFAITTLYWTALYNGERTTMKLFLTIIVHFSNSVFMFIDVLTCDVPIPVKHIIHPFLYGWTYAAWSMIHWVADIGDGKGHRYIYSILDYSHAGEVLGLFVFLNCAFLPGVYFGLSYFKIDLTYLREPLLTHSYISMDDHLDFGGF